MNKSELRKTYLARQKALEPAERAGMSKQIAELFFSSLDLSNVRTLHCFIPIEKFKEVDTRLIFGKLWSDFPHILTVVPRVDFDTNEITSLTYTAETRLEANAWEIGEPTHDDYVDTRAIDMVLVPGLCFDRLGHRVGYGKGFYDRFLSRCRYDCVRVGLSYFAPVDEIEDVHDGDMRIDCIITPSPA